MRYTILIGLLAAIALPARAEIPLDAAEITQSAQLIRGGRTMRLQPRQSLDEGDTIKTGDGYSSAVLHFVRDGVLTLGRNSQLFIYGASPPSLGRGDVLRVQLLHGELTLEAYPASNTIPKDYRVNIGPLQVRALGADMWAYANSEGESVCLHQGALEITGSAGEQRLDIVGDCLQHRTDGPLKVLQGAETELRDRLLAAEQYVLDPTVIRVEPAQQPAAVRPESPVKPPALIVVTPHKTTANSAARWVIVMATAHSRAAADDIAYKLAKRTLRTTVRETGKASQPFSVTFGDFATKKEAAQFAQKLQRRYRLKIVRVAALS